MPRNRSEAEPTIEGASEALMHVLRTDAIRATPAGDCLYEALSEAEKTFYTELDDGLLNQWAVDYKLWLKFGRQPA